MKNDYIFPKQKFDEKCDIVLWISLMSGVIEDNWTSCLFLHWVSCDIVLVVIYFLKYSLTMYYTKGKGVS